MIKIDLSRTISERMNVPMKEVDRFIAVFTDVVGETLEKGDEIKLAGFGVFGVRHVPEHQGRNPKTGEQMTIPASYYSVFKAGKGLRERVSVCKKPIADKDVPSKVMLESKPSASAKPSPAPKKRKNQVAQDAI